ncbi:MAG TPA: patatin-like phospholipase family protein [Verrucomicrobiae bacterium]|nr:patatin-like phospholipase family protein [Verrucomicrobiae bacterium]
MWPYGPAGLPRPTERVLTLAWLSDKLPDRFISETLARRVHAETGRNVALVSLEEREHPVNGFNDGQHYAMLNVDTSGSMLMPVMAGPVAHMRVQVPVEGVSEGMLDSMLTQLKEHYHYVLLHLGPEVPVALLVESFVQSDKSFLFLQPTSVNLYHRELLMRVLRGQTRTETLNLRTIICREQGEAHSNQLLKEMGDSIHGFVHGCPPPALAHGIRHWGEKVFHADIRRLAREIGHCRVGMALSSGGARGLSHIGIIQVFEENGIEVDVIAGCSMGSYVGSVWAYGYDGIFMERLAREVEKRWGLLELVDPFILPRQGFLRGEKVKHRLKRSIGDVHFSELARPLRVVATNLATLERVVISSGEVAAAVHASSAIPGACIPVEIGGERYIDGGIADPLPVDVLEEMGIERIIAVNTIPTASYLRARHEMEREHAALRRKRSNKLKALFNKYLNYFAPGNILDIILRSFHGAQMHVAEMSSLRAHVVLRPLSFDGRWHDFRRPGKYIALGRREAEEHMDEVKALLRQKETAHESEPAQDTVAPVA